MPFWTEAIPYSGDDEPDPKTLEYYKCRSFWVVDNVRKPPKEFITDPWFKRTMRLFNAVVLPRKVRVRTEHEPMDVVKEPEVVPIPRVEALPGPRPAASFRTMFETLRAQRKEGASRGTMSELKPRDVKDEDGFDPIDYATGL